MKLFQGSNVKTENYPEGIRINLDPFPPVKAVHPLEEVFAAALAQATKGKGVRHGGEDTDFLKQPWVHYAKMHGRGFLTGQAAKKLEEAASTRNGKAFEDEVLGAIVYCAMAILSERSNQKD
jgi:hypothetical protein